MERYVQIAHAVSGRVRLRVPYLRKRRDECADAASVLAALPGVAEVRVRPFTGSFLVRFDATRLGPTRVAVVLGEAIGAPTIVAAGERPPARPHADGPAAPSAVGRALYQVFRDVNADLLRASGGGIDLGLLATAVFFAAGAVEVSYTRRIPAPPWFNLAWWGLRTFIDAERELERERPAGDGEHQTSSS